MLMGTAVGGGFSPSGPVLAKNVSSTGADEPAPPLPIGVENLGNACYASTLLHCLFRATEFRDILKTINDQQGQWDKDNKVIQ